MMKRIGKILAGLLVLVANLNTSAQEKSLLWQVSGNGLKKPSYIFGTIHMICKDDYFWTDAMKQSFAKSDKVCLEMDMDDMNVMMSVTSGMMDKTGKKLSDYFTADQYKRLSKYVKDSLGMEISMFEMMKPVVLQTLMASRGTYCEDAVSYEEHIMKSAQEASKEILGLESPEDQLKVLESIPVDSVIKSVMEAVGAGGANEEREEYAQLVSTYKAQDIAGLHKMIVASGEFGGETDVFIDDRNKKWIGPMKGMMNKSSVFFAVGAGHLSGQNGVINLLKNSGYKVEPLK
jgi:uncharacterized protein